MVFVLLIADLIANHVYTIHTYIYTEATDPAKP